MATDEIVTFLTLGTPNKNGRVYNIENIVEIPKDRPLWCTMGFCNGPNINMEKIAASISDVHVDGEQVKGTLKILNTPQGNILQTLKDNGVEVAYRTAGHGRMDNQGVVHNYTLLYVAVVSPDTAA